MVLFYFSFSFYFFVVGLFDWFGIGLCLVRVLSPHYRVATFKFFLIYVFVHILGNFYGGMFLCGFFRRLLLLDIPPSPYSFIYPTFPSPIPFNPPSFVIPIYFFFLDHSMFYPFFIGRSLPPLWPFSSYLNSMVIPNETHIYKSCKGASTMINHWTLWFT